MKNLKALRRVMGMVVAAVCLAPAAAGLVGCNGAPTAFQSFERHTEEDVAFANGVNRPPSAKLLYASARLLSAQGKDAEARYVLTRIVEQYPGFMPAHCDLAEIHMRHGRIEQAAQTLTDALALVPGDAVLLNNLGMCRVLQGEHEQGLELFTAAAEGAPENLRYAANCAFAMGMCGRYDESLAAYKRLLPAAESHYNVAVLCEARRDASRARSEYQRATQLGLAVAEPK